MRKTFSLKTLRDFTRFSLVVLGLAGFIMTSAPRTAYATCNPCTFCPANDCIQAELTIQRYHQQYVQQLKVWISQQFLAHKQWLVNDFFNGNVAPALFSMAEQLTVTGMHQMVIIGMFFDSKHQLETQRLLQELQNEAHKDYTPSEDFCWFGTNVRSMAASEQIGRYNALALGERQMARHLGQSGGSGADDRDNDKLNRWRAFTGTYCDPHDNNWDSGVTGSGLSLACGAAGGGNTDRVNIDVDFTRLIDESRTLDIDYTDGSAPTADEQDVIALGNNIYGHDVLARGINPKFLKDRQGQHLYMALRSVAAKRSVAENSYNAIVGLKSSGTSDPAATPPLTRDFLGAVLTELGVPAAEVYDLIGTKPSYYAQLEIMAKKIYQNPDFFANLYDKPANVKRKSVALKAIELMLDRAIYESQLRQEMATSVLLSARLRPNFRSVNKELGAGG